MDVALPITEIFAFYGNPCCGSNIIGVDSKHLEV